MFSLSYRNYLLMLLVIVGVTTNFERFVFSLVLEPIKQELLLSDSQLGLMTGMAFFAFYAIAGIPIARWSDRGNRGTITALAVGICGLMVSLCGMATSFIQLLAVRAGVAIGEAGIMPAGQSLISDYFNRHERPRAMAIYISFYSISMIIGFLLGGLLVDAYGWRYTFILIGLPTLVIGVLAKFTIKDPRRFNDLETNVVSENLSKTVSLLLKQQSYRQILIIFCLGYFFNAGVSQWLPTFLIRSHGMTVASVGGWMAVVFGVFGTFGIFAGGHIASRYAANNEKRQMRMLTVSTLGYGVANTIAYLAPNKWLCLVFLAIGAFLLMLNNGPLFAAIQSLVAERMRSLAVAITFLVGNLVGFGLGPLALGVVSDYLNDQYAQDSLRYALLFFCPGTLWIAFHYWKVSNTIEKDIFETEQGMACQR
ncbi:spinster family MFS transporter [SAR92 clade bacterium H246]